MNEKLPENRQRWTAKRRSALVLSILRGETSSKEAARKDTGAGQVDSGGDECLPPLAPDLGPVRGRRGQFP